MASAGRRSGEILPIVSRMRSRLLCSPWSLHAVSICFVSVLHCVRIMFCSARSLHAVSTCLECKSYICMHAHTACTHVRVSTHTRRRRRRRDGMQRLEKTDRVLNVEHTGRRRTHRPTILENTPAEHTDRLLYGEHTGRPFQLHSTYSYLHSRYHQYAYMHACV